MTIAEHEDHILSEIQRQFVVPANDTLNYCTCPSMGTARGWVPNLHHALERLRTEGIPDVSIQATSSHGCIDWVLVKGRDWRPAVPPAQEAPPQWCVDAEMIVENAAKLDSTLDTSYGIKTVLDIADMIYRKYMESK